MSTASIAGAQSYPSDIKLAIIGLGYVPTQHIAEGLGLAMPWYIAQK